MEELGWKNWKRESDEDEAKKTFLGGLSDMADWARAKMYLEEAQQLLGTAAHERGDSADKESSNNGDDDFDERRSPEGTIRSKSPGA
jgi:hypothetical protein